MAKQKETAKKQADEDFEKSVQEDEGTDEPLKKYTDGPTIKYPVPDADPSTEDTTPIQDEPHKLDVNLDAPRPDFVPAIDTSGDQTDEDDESQK